jgi:hypothetical protein
MHSKTDSNLSADQTLAPWTPQDMLEVRLAEPDDFLKVRETLTRIGVASNKEHNTLYQSCHILHKQGRYMIVHFKELFMLDGKPSNFYMDDLARRNTIAKLLEDWGLIQIVDLGRIHNKSNLRQIKIISHKEKHQWTLLAKYTVGNVKKNR